MPRTSSRLAKIEEENKAAEEANKRELEKLRAVLASKEKKTKKPAKTKTVSKKSRKVAAEKAGQLLTVVQMLKKKLLAPGPITLDHHKSKPTRITKKVRAHSDRARRPRARAGRAEQGRQHRSQGRRLRASSRVPERARRGRRAARNTPP